MAYLKERVAYFKGLMDGVELPEKSKEARLFAAVAEILDDMADSIELNEQGVDELNDVVDELSEGLEAVEDIVYDDDPDFDEDFDGDEEAGVVFGTDDEDELPPDSGEKRLNSEDFVEFTCKECGDKIYFDPDFVQLAPELSCPNCGKQMVASVSK